MALTSGTKLGPYEIQSPLGAGGMGEVYRARDTRLDRIVAIKVLPSHLSSDPELKQRMEREAKAISSLQHANICTLYDIGSQDGTDFLVMEYLEGETLAERLAKGPLLLDQVLKTATEIAQALEKAHRQGIIHRDLKPANIMLTKAGAKLMDFGLAKPSAGVSRASRNGSLTTSTPTMSVPALTADAVPLTQRGTIVGTFQYMAPEALQGVEVDARSDIFSFGCVLYETVTGRRAFEGKSQFSVLGAILDKEPERVSALLPNSPPRLDETVRRCLAKNPEYRYGCMHDVRIQLETLASGESEQVPATASSSATSWRARLPWVMGDRSRRYRPGDYLRRVLRAEVHCCPGGPVINSASRRHRLRDYASIVRSSGVVAGWHEAGLHSARRQECGSVIRSFAQFDDSASPARNSGCHLPLLVSGQPRNWILCRRQAEKN
jgi:serine/threonine protein kinase